MEPTIHSAPATLAGLEERRAAAGIAAVADEAQPVAGGQACFAGPDAWATQAVGMGLAGPVPPEEVDRLVAFYADRGVAAPVELCPYVHPSLVDALDGAGFTLRGMETVLARSLATLDLPEVLDVAVCVVDQADAEAIADQVDLCMRGFFAPADPPTVFASLGRKVAAQPGTCSVVATVEGEPAGAAAVEVRGEIAALFSASVLPRFRRRGVHRALLAARLVEAARGGAVEAVVHGEPGGATERGALRLGFVPVYTRVQLIRRGAGLAEPP